MHVRMHKWLTDLKESRAQKTTLSSSGSSMVSSTPAQLDSSAAVGPGAGSVCIMLSRC